MILEIYKKKMYWNKHFYIKTAAVSTGLSQVVYQRGCISGCTDTGKIINGQPQGLFCCNITSCNTIQAQQTTLSTQITTTTTIATTSFSCYTSSITTDGLGTPTVCGPSEKYCFVI